jgi:SNF2 family DNA or RNA helicase
MTNIQIIDRKSVRFYKKLWHESELILAQCFGFSVDNDSSVILADIAKTNKQAMYEFVRTCFKNFSESIDEAPFREIFFNELEEVYAELDAFVELKCRERLPYYDKLYTHQKEGIRFGFFNRCSFLAYQMRLGKSVTAISFSRIFNIKRTLIVCPAVAKMGWFRDMTKIWGFNDLYFSVLDASSYRTFKALQERFVIVNYDSLAKFEKHILSDDIGHIIIDEAHKIKNRHSNRFEILQKIVAAYPDARITMLSGTPIPNRFNDLFAYFKLTKHYLGQSYKKFLDEFTIRTYGRGGEKVTGAKNIKDLKLKMSNFMIVKTMDECFDMPEDVISRYTFQMEDYRPEYDKIIKEMSEAKELAALNGHIHSLNIITCKSKIPGIIEAIEEILSESKKIVVFGTYKEPLQLLQDYFGERCLKIVGGVSSFDRDQYKQRFTNDEKIEVMLANYEAGGEALDLSVANDVFIINFPLTPKELNQATFRIKHPEKRNKHVRIHYTFCENSIDEHIYDNIIVDKSIDINALLHDGKDVVERGNVTEILIKSILKKDDVHFIHGRGKKEELKSDLDSTKEDYSYLSKNSQVLIIDQNSIPVSPVKQITLPELPDFT